MDPQNNRPYRITMVGLNFKTAPLAVRESVAIAPDQLGKTLSCLNDLVLSGVILSTCHRTEIYALTQPGFKSFHHLSQFMENIHHPYNETIIPYLYHYQDEEAVRHLFKVSGGLDSMVIGEPQILGQVREAFLQADSFGTVSHEMSALFRQAIHAGKRIRGSTTVGQQGFGTYHAALDIAKKASPQATFSDCRILVIGAGKVGGLLVSLLADSGANEIHIANRTVEKAISLANQVGGNGWGLESVEELLPEMDVVFSAAQIDEPIITKDMLISVMRQRQDAALVLIDTGLPSNIDPSVRDIREVVLYTVDDLYLGKRDSQMVSDSEITKVLDIIDGATAAYMDWFYSLEMIPIIVALRQRFEEIRQQELAKQASRLKELSEDEYRTVDMLTNRIIKKILHHPTVRLKEAPSQNQGDSFAEMMEELFALELNTDGDI